MKKIGLLGLERGQMLKLQWRISIHSLNLHQLAGLKTKLIIMISIHNLLILIIQIFKINLILHQAINSFQYQVRLYPGHQYFIPSRMHSVLNHFLMFQMHTCLTMLETGLWLEIRVLCFTNKEICPQVHLFISRRYLLVIPLLQVIIH